MSSSVGLWLSLALAAAGFEWLVPFYRDPDLVFAQGLLAASTLVAVLAFVAAACLLAAFLAEPYFTAPPPKSTGREYFNAAWLAAHDVGSHAPEDVQATLAALTAQTLAAAFPEETTQVVLCGGGRLNPQLLSALADTSTAPVTPCDALGVDGDALEAAAFAWLAHRRLEHAVGNAPAVLAARDVAVGGQLRVGSGNRGEEQDEGGDREGLGQHGVSPAGL